MSVIVFLYNGAQQLSAQSGDERMNRSRRKEKKGDKQRPLLSHFVILYRKEKNEYRSLVPVFHTANTNIVKLL